MLGNIMAHVELDTVITYGIASKFPFPGLLAAGSFLLLLNTEHAGESNQTSY